MSYYQSLFNTQTVNANVFRFSDGAQIGYFLSSADKQGTFKWVPIGDFVVEDILSTANQTTVSNDSHGIYTIGTVQDINITSTPEFYQIKLSHGAQNGYILKSNGSGLASWESLGSLAVTSISAVNNQTTVSNNNGAYTIGTVQDINTTSDVEFSSITTNDNYKFKNSTIKIYKHGNKLLFTIDGSNDVLQIESDKITSFQPLLSTNIKTNSIDAYSGTDITLNNHNLTNINNIYVGKFAQFKGSDPEILIYNDTHLSRLRLICSGGKNYIQSTTNGSNGSIADLIFSSLNDTFEWIKLRASQQDIQAVSIIPFINNIHSLGSYAYRWNNGYINYLYGYNAELKTANPFILLTNDDGKDSSILRIISSNQTNYLQSGLSLTNDSKADLSFSSIFAASEWLRLRASTFDITSVSILPKITNTYNLGSPSLTWNNIYAVTFNGNLTGSATYVTNPVQNAIQTLSNLSTAGSLTNLNTNSINSSAGIFPSINNTYDLGSYSMNWNNIYSSNYRIGTDVLISQSIAKLPQSFINSNIAKFEVVNASANGYISMYATGSSGNYIQSGITNSTSITDTIFSNVGGSLEWIRMTSGGDVLIRNCNPRIHLTSVLGTSLSTWLSAYIQTVYATTVSATNLVGTLTTSVQTSIKQLGTLLGLNILGDLNVSSGTIYLNDTSATPSIIRMTQSGGVNYIQSATAMAANSKADLAFTSMFADYEWMRLRSSTNDITASSIIPNNSNNNLGSQTNPWNSIYLKSSGGTSTALDYYEEGSFTPSISGGTIVTNSVMRYTRIGRKVTVSMDNDMVITFSGGVCFYITNLPNSIKSTKSFTELIRTTYGTNPIHAVIGAWCYSYGTTEYIIYPEYTATMSYLGDATFNATSITYNI